MTRHYIPGETIPPRDFEPLLRRYGAMIAQRALELCGTVPAHIEQINSATAADFQVIWMRNRHTHAELRAWAQRERQALESVDGTRLP